jgi:AhpD family alkylhydroperoxidase
MDERTQEKINKIIEDRKQAHQFYVKQSPVYQAFLEMEKRAFSDGTLAKKYKELVALGISIVINCESCIEWHTEQAIKAGASEAEILETIEVGIEMGGGPATVSSRFALSAMQFHSRKK